MAAAQRNARAETSAHRFAVLDGVHRPVEHRRAIVHYRDAIE
jgi:hypothetical protein